MDYLFVVAYGGKVEPLAAAVFEPLLGRLVATNEEVPRLGGNSAEVLPIVYPHPVVVFASVG